MLNLSHYYTREERVTHRSNSVHNTVLNNHISSSDLGAVEVDTAVPDGNSNGAVGEGVEDLAILKERGVADVVDNDVLAEDADDLLVGEAGGVNGSKGAVLGGEDGDAGGLTDGLNEVELGQEGGEVGELGEEAQGGANGAGDLEEAVVGEWSMLSSGVEEGEVDSGERLTSQRA